MEEEVKMEEVVMKEQRVEVKKEEEVMKERRRRG